MKYRTFDTIEVKFIGPDTAEVTTPCGNKWHIDKDFLEAAGYRDIDSDSLEEA